jgi:hypothetical protein
MGDENELNIREVGGGEVRQEDDELRDERRRQGESGRKKEKKRRWEMQKRRVGQESVNRGAHVDNCDVSVSVCTSYKISAGTWAILYPPTGRLPW